jgi:hypothetical protein
MSSPHRKVYVLQVPRTNIPFHFFNTYRCCWAHTRDLARCTNGSFRVDQHVSVNGSNGPEQPNLLGLHSMECRPKIERYLLAFLNIQ